MKPIILIPVLLVTGLTGCISQTPRKIIIADATPPLHMTNAAALRTPELLKEYRFARYVDPGDPLAMHEGHPVYRIETSAGWNLSSGGNAAPRANAASQPIAANDAVVAEVNKQRAATRAFTEQTGTLNLRLGELSQAVAQTQEVAKENLALKSEMAAIRDRLDSLDAQIRDRRPAAAPHPPSVADDKW